MDTKWSWMGDWVVGREEGGWVGHLDHDADELGGGLFPFPFCHAEFSLFPCVAGRFAFPSQNGK